MKLAQDRALPGMEQVRVRRLDDICHELAEVRATMAQARADEEGAEKLALDVMHRHNLRAYHASGVELAIVPGEEKLRVRTSKGTRATATTTDDLGDGQDPAEALDALDADREVLQ